MLQFNQGIKICIFLILLFLNLSKLCAQDNSHIHLIDYFNILESKYSVTFSMDAKEIAKEYISTKDTTHSSLEDALEKLKKNTRFQFEQIERYILVSISTQYDQDFCLILVDSTSLSLKNVLVKSLKSTQYYQVSDLNGKVSFKANSKSGDTLIIDHLGYKKTYVPISDLSSNCTTIVLYENVVLLDEITIQRYITEGTKAIISDNSLQISPNELALLPGQTGGDILQSIAALPGISSPNSKAGNLYIRGSSTDQTLVYFDNIPVYSKGHYFGTLSPFNQQVVEDVTIYRSGSHPKIGGRIGGVIEIETKKNIDSLTGTLSLNTTDAGFSLATPIIKEKLSVIIGARTSLPSSLNTPKQKNLRDFNTQDVMDIDNRTFDVFKYDFNDVNGKLIYETNNGVLTSSALHSSSSEVQKFTNNKSSNYSKQKISTNNFGTNLDYTQIWSPKMSTYSSITYSKYNNITDVLSVNPKSDTVNIKFFDTNIEDLMVKFETKKKFKKSKDFIDFGYHFNNQKNLITIKDRTRNRPDLSKINAQEQSNQTLFLNYNLRRFKKLSTNLGLRANYYQGTQRVYLSPRLMANYQMHKNIFIKGSYGIYNQYINQLLFFDFNDKKPENFNWGLAEKNNQLPSRSFQSMIGFFWKKKSWLLDVEFYHKKITPIYFGTGIRTNGVVGIEDGQSRSYGLNALLRKEFNNFTTWASYSLSKVIWNFDALENGKDLYAYYDQRHTLDIGSVYKLNNFTFSAGFKLISGVPNLTANVTPLGSPDPNFSPRIAYNGRYPWQHQIDLAAAYKLIPKSNRWNSVISISIQNLYDRRTLIESFVGPDGNTYESKTLGFTPNAQVLVCF